MKLKILVHHSCSSLTIKRTPIDGSFFLAISLRMLRTSVLVALVLLQMVIGSVEIPLHVAHSWPRYDLAKIGFQAAICETCEMEATKETNVPLTQILFESRRKLVEHVDCDEWDFQGSNLEKLSKVAAMAMSCPERLDACIVAEQWQKQWTDAPPPAANSSTCGAEGFANYVLRRKHGFIVDLATITSFERELVKSYNYLSSMARDNILREEAELRESPYRFINDGKIPSSDDLRHVSRNWVCPYTNFGDIPREIVYGAALHAFKCAKGRPRLLDLAEDWLVWWDTIQPSSSSGDRTDADRFLDYVVMRRSGEIPDTDEIERKEIQLASRFKRIVSRWRKPQAPKE